MRVLMLNILLCCRLNAYVSGYVTHDEMRDYVDAWSKESLVSQDVFERLSFYLK